MLRRLTEWFRRIFRRTPPPPPTPKAPMPPHCVVSGVFVPTGNHKYFVLKNIVSSEHPVGYFLPSRSRGRAPVTIRVKGRTLRVWGHGRVQKRGMPVALILNGISLSLTPRRSGGGYWGTVLSDKDFFLLLQPPVVDDA